MTSDIAEPLLEEVSENGISLVRRRAFRIVLDACLLIGFIAEFVTREGPDYAVHSWIGIVLLPVAAVHVASNWRWVTSTFRRRTAHPEWHLARFNAAFSVVTVICIASGFPIWLEWSDSGAWTGLHTLTGFAAILLALSHLWRNRHRLGALLRRRATAPAI